MGEPTYDFSGRRVVVTGGTRGLGLTVAHAFADAGAQVTITGTQYLTSFYDADLSRFSYFQLRLNDRDAIIDTAERIKAVDILVNAAGVRLPASEAHDREFIAHAARLGLIGPFALATRLRYRLGESRVRGGGSVINTPIVRQWFDLTHGSTASGGEYAALTQRIGTTWGRHGVRVNSLSAGVQVPRQTQLRVQIDRSSGPLLTRSRLQGAGTLEEVASVVMYLASSGAASLTGQTMELTT